MKKWVGKKQSARPIVLAAACCLAWEVSVMAQAIQPPVPPRRLIVNDDGHGGFYGGRLDRAEALRKHPQRFRDTHLWIYQWGVMLGTKVNYPSKVVELCGEGATPEVLSQVREGDRRLTALLQKLRADGVDTLQCVAQGCHEAGILCYVTIRANPVYPLKAQGWPDGSMAGFYNAKFWWDHPEFRIVQKSGKEHPALSYAFPEVREWKLAILREALQRDIDGIDIDFLRHPPVLGYEAPLVQGFQAKFSADPKTLPDDDARWLQYRCDVMSDFMREVRRAVNEAAESKGRPLGISVRIDHRYFRAWGLDIEAWMKERLIDILVVGQHGLGGYVFDLTPFVKMAEGTGCLVFVSEEGIVEGRDPAPQDERDPKAVRPPSRAMTLQEHCRRAATWYGQGASGIHLFNQLSVDVAKALGDAALCAETGKEARIKTD
ncbi:MAG: hypothetical protein AB1696_18670 [Planctomycetota bacterium]